MNHPSFSSPSRIGILGGGPAGLFMYKRLVESGRPGLEVIIFEKTGSLGKGMPYSAQGAETEHITNVSDNEIPELVRSMKEWIRQVPESWLHPYHIKPEDFNEYKVVPRLLFGQYLSDQFQALLKKGKAAGIITTVLFHTKVEDVKDLEDSGEVQVFTSAGESYVFDAVVICTGHNWPTPNEALYPNYFDSPYPPSKLARKINYPVAVRGSSLTAIDAVRTLARQNGHFTKNEDHTLQFHLAPESESFRIVMHSTNGMLPAVRFHLEDSHLGKDAVISDEEIHQIRSRNDGFIPLDYLFERNFKEPVRLQDPAFYEQIKQLGIEEFVARMMSLREELDAFTLLKAEYLQAEKSIRRHQSVYWKEMLGVLSFAMNYPAKYLCAEDMMRLRKTLMPIISIVIAYVPQSSCRELMALHQAGVLRLVAVGKDSKVSPRKEGGAVYTYANEEGVPEEHVFDLFVDSIGQPALQYQDLPFGSLRSGGTVSGARIRFREAAAAEKALGEGSAQVEKGPDGYFYLKVPGIAINDYFQVLNYYGAYNPRVYMMAVPYIGGFNPDYSGLDFCEAASARILRALFSESPAGVTVPSE